MLLIFPYTIFFKTKSHLQFEVFWSCSFPKLYHRVSNSRNLRVCCVTFRCIVHRVKKLPNPVSISKPSPSAWQITTRGNQISVISYKKLERTHLTRVLPQNQHFLMWEKLNNQWGKENFDTERYTSNRCQK